MSDSHPSESDLLWYFYGESESTESIQEHLESCGRCREVLDDYGQLRIWSDGRSSGMEAESDPETTTRRIQFAVESLHRRAIHPTRLLFTGIAGLLVVAVSFWAGRQTAPETVRPSSIANETEFVGARLIRPVADVERAAAWYRDRLGLRVLAQDAFSCELAAPGDGMTVHLFKRGLPGCPASAALREAGTESAVLFDVTNLRRAHARLEERGVLFVPTPKGRDRSPNRILIDVFRDPDGHALGLFRLPR